MDLYINDPLCGFSLDDAGMGGLIAAGPRFADVEGVRQDLPILVFVGTSDPLNAALSRTDVAVERYNSAGIEDVTYYTYPGARHEIFNETNRDDVINDLTTWMDRVLEA